MRVRAIVIRILLQLHHDKRTAALMILAPVLVLTLMWLIFGGDTYQPKIALVNAPQQFADRLEDDDSVVLHMSEYDAGQALSRAEIDAIVSFESGEPKIKLEGVDSTKSRAVLMQVERALRPDMNAPEPDVTYLYGYKDIEMFDNFGPILIGFFVFFFVFLVAGISFLGERNTGTLERVLATPLRRWELVLGYLLGFGIFTVLQSALIAWFAVNILGVMMVGSFELVLALTILTAMTALCIGTFISAFANNEMQMIQFIPIVIVPQVFFSGLFDLSTMAPPLQALAHFMPLWYVADALRGVMLRGYGWGEVWFDALVLGCICLFFVCVNILALKKHRRI